MLPRGSRLGGARRKHETDAEGQTLPQLEAGANICKLMRERGGLSSSLGPYHVQEVADHREALRARRIDDKDHRLNVLLDVAHLTGVHGLQQLERTQEHTSELELGEVRL